MTFRINPYNGNIDLVGTGSGGGGPTSADQVTIPGSLGALLNGAANVEDALVELEIRTRFYIHTQAVASTVWTIPHNLDVTNPSITVYNTGNMEVIGGMVSPTDSNNLTITFDYAIDGTAWLFR